MVFYVNKLFEISYETRPMLTQYSLLQFYFIAISAGTKLIRYAHWVEMDY